jgi:hypothetical protein
MFKVVTTMFFNAIKPITKTKLKLANTAGGLLIFAAIVASNPVMAMGRNDAPCTLGVDCMETVYYHLCNNRCFWY